MNQAQYRDYLQAEIDTILRFKETEEKSTGRQLSRNDAASIWIERYADAFSKRMRPYDNAMQDRLIS